MLRPWRCLNCTKHPKTFDWIGEKGVCPQCGLNCKDHPRAVYPLVIIHFVEKQEFDEARRSKRACDLTKHAATVPLGQQPLGDLTDVHAATGDPHYVTCPACMKTAAYVKALNGEVSKSVFHDEDVPEPGPSDKS